MKRSWLGFGLLLVLLVLSLAATGILTRAHEQTVLELELSSEAALLGDWEDVHLLLRRADRRWTKWAHIFACFADHGPVEQIDADFAVLDVCRQSRQAESYRVACTRLAKQITDLAEAQALTWWNLF
ncbi:MAG: DUF4363 family protein [Oscillospiraceae bacterium]|nr:DUF4363 family protein [Oscillospiraceae bacterium]